MTIVQRHKIEIDRVINRIVQSASRMTGAGVHEIANAKTRRREIDIRGRAVAIMAVMRLVGLKQIDVAKRFGYSDHSIIAYLIRKHIGDGDIMRMVDGVCREVEAAGQMTLPWRKEQ